MQKTIVDLATDYRIVTDGRRYRIQKKFNGTWSTGYETRWRWLARWRLKSLRASEARRRADATTVWESVDP